MAEFKVPQAFYNQLSEFAPRGWRLLIIDQNGNFCVSEKLDTAARIALNQFENVMTETQIRSDEAKISMSIGELYGLDDSDTDDDDN